MKIGLHTADFTFPNGPGGLAADLARVVAADPDGRRRGAQDAAAGVPQVWEPERIALLQREVIPAADEL